MTVPYQPDMRASDSDREKIAARLRDAHAEGRLTLTEFQDRLAETDADMLVLGAYSHSWLRRLIFGGVTNSVLRAGAVAAFLSR